MKMRATLIGFTAILMWALLALFTAASGKMPPFQLSAVLLLVGMIAAIALTHRKRKNTKFQDPAQQVAVKAADRLVVLKMDAEKPAHAESENTQNGEKA